MKKGNKRGISLIVLVITIIVIIILAGAVILNLSGNNPVENAKKAQFKSDLDTFKSELSLYKAKQTANTIGDFEQTGLNADFSNLSYTGKVGTVTGTNIKDIITSITDKYNGKVKIYNGELVYEGVIEKEQEWAKESGLMLYNSDTNVAMVITDKTVVKSGTNMVYTVKVYSSLGVTNIEGLNGKLTLINESGNTVLDSSKITLSESTPTINGLQKEITIDTTGLAEGNYRLKLEANAVSNSKETKNEETISAGVFTIDNTPPGAVQFTLSTSEWAKSVDVTITYSNDAEIKEYSTDGINWLIYTSPVTVDINNTIVYARSKDKAENQSDGQANIKIDKIDNVTPSISDVSVTLEGNNLKIIVTASDINSGLDDNPYSFSIDNGVTYSVYQSSNIYNPTIVSGNTYNVLVKVIDKVGNVKISDVKTIATLVDLPASSIMTSSSTFDGLDANYDNPIIPAGFQAVNVGSTSVNPTPTSWENRSTDYNKGLVIQDSKGNQFVWVPCTMDGIAGVVPKYEKWCIVGLSYLNCSDISLPAYITGGETAQITKYKGFYIGRFEAGDLVKTASNKMRTAPTDSATNEISIKQNQIPYNYISYSNATTNISGMYSSYSSYVKAYIATGTMWDTVMKWIDGTTIPNFSISGITYKYTVKDSRRWGNYSDAYAPSNETAVTAYTKTGVSERRKANNIYDLAGNVSEMTAEYQTSTSASDYTVLRGGDRSNTGSTNASASYRTNWQSAGNINGFMLCFRVALYVQ